MAISEARLAANRANAKKSTGPRTPEGKARSRCNALQHGLSASVLGCCEDGLRPVLGALHRPDPRDIEALLWPGATQADKVLAVQVATCRAQKRALQQKTAGWLDELELFCAAQRAMVLCEPDTVARLGWRVDNPSTLRRRGYFGWPWPKILGWPWQPTGKGRIDALSKLLRVQRYERGLRHDRRRLIRELDRRRELALAGPARAGEGEACAPVSLPAWPEIPVRPVWQAPQAEVEALASIMGPFYRPKVLASGSPEALALTFKVIAEVETLFAKRTHAPVHPEAGFPPGISADATTRAAGLEDGRGVLARPRPPPGDADGTIIIMPGQSRGAWRPGPEGHVPVGARVSWGDGGPASPHGPLAAGRLAHEPRPHGLRPNDPLVPLIPPRPILDERMNEFIVTLDPTGTRGRERDEPAELPMGRWIRGPDGRFDRFRPGKGTYRDPYLPVVWWNTAWW